jgi:hypothetical protein
MDCVRLPALLIVLNAIIKAGVSDVKNITLLILKEIVSHVKTSTAQYALKKTWLLLVSLDMERIIKEFASNVRKIA